MGFTYLPRTTGTVILIDICHFLMTGNHGPVPKDPWGNCSNYQRFLPSCGGDCPRNCPGPVGGHGKVLIKPSCPAGCAECSRNQPCGTEHLLSIVPSHQQVLENLLNI